MNCGPRRKNKADDTMNRRAFRPLRWVALVLTLAALACSQVGGGAKEG